MNSSMKKRVMAEAIYILDTGATIRKTAKLFNVGKSTVYTDLSTRLKSIDEDLYHKIDIIFKEHDASKHLKGGEATRKKYKNEV